MSDKIRKVLFVEPVRRVGKPKVRIKSPFGRHWVAAGSRVNADGVSEHSITRLDLTFDFKDFGKGIFVEDQRDYRNWMGDLTINFGPTMAEILLGHGSVDAVVVRSELLFQPTKCCKEVIIDLSQLFYM